MIRFVKGVLCLCCAALGLTAAAAGQNTATTIKTTEDIASAFKKGEWPTYNGDYTGKRYSGLTQITPDNVKQLRAVWVFHSRNAGTLEVTPVVVNGVMYVTASNDAYALNAEDGQILWHYSRPVSDGLIDDAAGHINRGVAVWGDRLYMETDNAHLLCLDARSGHLIWDIAYTDGNKNYGATSAPLMVKGKVIVGTSGGDDGVRGFIAAFDAQTGAEVWRRWTIPAPGEFGSSSWPGNLYLHGGGASWMPGTFDPELNTLYWGTGNAAPDYDGTGRPGDDLYTACVLGLDPDTGAIKWYFQFTPHDLYDFDGVETPVLVDRIYDGQPRKLLMEANRNGFFYILDRTNGKFLSATRFAEKLNWAKGIDPQGRPIYTDVKPTAEGTLVCPGEVGASNWYSPAYNPGTQLFYFLALDECSVNSSKPQEFEEGKEFYATGGRRDPNAKGKKRLMAFDASTHSFAWIYPQVGNAQSWGGVMTTAAGLVFFADDANSFEAVDARTGKSLWHFNTGQPQHASPMSYAVNGKQYVAIAAGDDLFTFALP
ncbi:pyrroloquinoline quinone-dependent dehydrogenase [Paracidobacterium acidisoli]|uniref:pyrroloquinoline quinone-dependent dehydrogenase n=1 Tax=Paracidobacterium acidisoli TaxID=2303751 RepID=UPI00207A49EB|nr:PQQ-dependent dehydrogenase, methanol/ethanol family [Paracidobacterium acidisoli]